MACEVLKIKIQRTRDSVKIFQLARKVSGMLGKMFCGIYIPCTADSDDRVKEAVRLILNLAENSQEMQPLL